MKALRMAARLAVLIVVFGAAIQAAADCLPIEQAPKKVGQMQCVTGKVLNVNHTKGAWYLNFCDDNTKCPFSVVVFERDLKDAEKLKVFEGKTIRIYGPIQEYHGRTEMTLKLEQQLSGEPGPYADALMPRQHKDRMPPVPNSAGTRRTW